MRATLDQWLHSVDYSLNQVLASNEVRRTWDQPLSAEQFELVRPLQEQLVSLQDFDGGISTIEIVNFAEDWLVTPTSVVRWSSYDDPLAYSADLKNPAASSWTIVRRSDTGQGQPAICGYAFKLVRKLPLDGIAVKGLAKIEIPACSMERLASLNTLLSDTVIMDTKERILLAGDGFTLSDAEADQAILAAREAAGTGGVLTVGDQGLKLTYDISDVSGWLFFQKAPASGLSLMYTGWGLALAAGLSGLLLFLRRKLVYNGYKPLDQLKRKEEQVLQLQKTNLSLEQQITSQLPQMRQYFTHTLLQGGVSRAGLESQLSALGYEVDTGAYIVLALQLDSLEHTRFSARDQGLLLYAINNMVEELVPSSERFMPIVLDQVQVTVLVGVPVGKQEQQEYVAGTVSLIQHQIQHYLSLNVSLGVSKLYRDLAEAGAAFKESMEALKYKTWYGENSVIHFDMLHGSKELYFPASSGLENELFEAVKIADMERAQTILKQLMKDIYHSVPNPNVIEISIVRLLLEFMNKLQGWGVNENPLQASRMSLLHQVLHLRSAEEAEDWFLRMLIQPAASAINEEMGRKKRSISDQIVDIIRNEFDTELSLELLAGRLHYNSNYLSGIFNKEMNITFSEYLTKYRHQMARKWLVETDYSIKEIAARLQYNNSQNFIRSFRKLQGMTPGEYRVKYTTTSSYQFTEKDAIEK
ncbi:helix-turn-helix domain-containing protein [Paenibacillus sp. y28]